MSRSLWCISIQHSLGNALGMCVCYYPVPDNDNKSSDTSNRTTIMVVSILSIVSAIIFACIIFLTCYIIRKQMMMWRYKAKRLPSFTEDVNHLLPGSPEIPSEAMPGKKSSLVC